MSILQLVKSWLPRSSFVRGVILIGGGATASQLILMASAPLLTRLYSTEQFGIVAVFSSILSILNMVSTLRYELAIPIAKDDEEAIHGLVLALLISLAMSCLSFIGVLCFREQIAVIVKIPEIARYLWLLPLGLLLRSIYLIFYYWGLRVKAFSAIARTKLTQSVGSVAIQIGGASFGTLSLLLGQIVGQGAGISSLVVLAIRDRWHLFQAVRFKQVLWVGWRYRQFPYFSTWAGLLNTIGTQMPPLLFAILFSPSAAGIYALAHRVLSLPMSLVGQAIGNVFFARAAEARREGTLAVLVARVHEKLAQIAMPPAIILALIGPDLFVWIFGLEWSQAGVFARLMAPMLYFQFIFSPISTLFSVLEKNKYGLFLQTMLVVSRCSSLLLGAKIGDINLTIFLFSLASVTSYLAFLFGIFIVSGNSGLLILKHTIQSFFFSMLFLTPLVIAVFFSLSIKILVLSLFVAICLICCRYYLILQAT